MLLRTCRFIWSLYHRPSLYWVTLKLIKGKIHFCQRGQDPGQNLSTPLSDHSSYGDKNQAWNRRMLGLPSGAGILLKAASGKEQHANGVWKYMWPVWSWYYQTVTCISLSSNRKWWLGAIFGVSANRVHQMIMQQWQLYTHVSVPYWSPDIWLGLEVGMATWVHFVHQWLNPLSKFLNPPLDWPISNSTIVEALKQKEYFLHIPCDYGNL